jgi:lipoyl synthase
MSLPPWIKQKAPDLLQLEKMKSKLDNLRLHTVCESAHCPNLGECFGRGTATVMIMGEICTRNCRFCAVDSGIPVPLDSSEPQGVAKLVKSLSLKHVVITSVTRDDLTDGGAGHFAQTVEAVRAAAPASTVEVLVPDFQGNIQALALVVKSKPHIINHNLETVPRLYGKVRPKADYRRSLALLSEVKKINSAIFTKSGIMVGFGESESEVAALMDDLLAAGCDIMTIGQYLRPSKEHLAVEEYVIPEMFEHYARVGEHKGFKYIASAPLVRSSYNAGEFFSALPR